MSVCFSKPNDTKKGEGKKHVPSIGYFPRVIRQQMFPFRNEKKKRLLFVLLLCML